MFLQQVSSKLVRTNGFLSRARHNPGTIGTAVRYLNVHEHISMELFNENGITTPKGAVAFTPEEAESAYKSMGNREYGMNDDCVLFENSPCVCDFLYLY